MPRNTREWAIRKVDMAVGNLEVAQRHLLEVVDVYIDPHPQIGAPLNDIIQLMEHLKKLNNDVRKLF